jgi:hypothetical protein
MTAPLNGEDWARVAQTAVERAAIPHQAALEAKRLAPVGPANIPPRRWAYGRFLLFGSAAVIGAVDGGGKGAIAVVMVLAMITGRPLLGETVWRTGPVLIVTYEDDAEEWHRRIAAACLHYSLDYETVLADIHFVHRPGGRVSFGTMVGGMLTFPDREEILGVLKTIGAVLLIVDPFNHAHGLDDGNNNIMVAKVAAELSRTALEGDVAVLVLHHLRKGASGSPDDLMGATSLRATFRSCRILARMTPDVAKKMKITEPWRYIRIAGSKENYAPPPGKASWFKLIGVPLGNATSEYPYGDDVAVATTWQEQQMFEGMELAVLGAVFTALKETIHGPNRQAKRLPWAGNVLVNLAGRTEREAGKIIAAWIKTGLLVKGEHRDADNRNKVQRVTVDDAKVAPILDGDQSG